MNRLVSVVCLAALLAPACYVQAQNTQPNNAAMSIAEFRQVLVDTGSYLDTQKNMNLRQRFEALSDEQLEYIFSAVPDPRKLQRAVSSLRKYQATRAFKNATRGQLGIQPFAPFPSCAADTIIDNSPGAVCTPSYPDPTNTAWQNMVNPPITFGAFSPTDYPSVAVQMCSLTVESNLVQTTSALNGTVTVAAIACGALPPIASNVCFAAVAVVGVAGAVSQGILADCSEQDGNVNSAEIDAAFHNTVTIYDTLGTVNNQITSEFSALSTQVTGVDTHLTNVDNHISGEFNALDAHLVMLFNQLSTQLTNSTDLATADLKQVMKLELEPEGLRRIVPAILTCTGTNCPNVLNKCPSAGCSWNNVGPLP